MDATPIIIKKKKHAAHAHHGGSWKVAYADFVTAMMAFFMVMWIMGLSDDTRTKIQGYFNDPIGFAKNEPRSKSVIPIKSVTSSQPGEHTRKDQPYEDDKKAIQVLKDKLQKALESSPELEKFLEHILIQVTQEGLRIEFLEDRDDFFESGQAVLKPGAVRVLHALGPKLAESGRPLIVEGHTDSVQFAGDPLRNWTLSSERASSVLGELGKAGVQSSKVRSVKGLADSDLRDPAHPTSAKNRRVTILLPFVAGPDSRVPMPLDQVNRELKGAVVSPISIQPVSPNITGKK